MTPTERHQAALDHLRKADPHPGIPPLLTILKRHEPMVWTYGYACDYCFYHPSLDPVWPCWTVAAILEAVENA